ncbi:MAG: hypothetical protein ACOYKK_06870 [Microbacteriaceae bacterium]
MSNSSDFRTARKGFDPSQVDATFLEIAEQIEKSATAANESEAILRRLKRELTDVRSKLRKIDSAPSFSELGSAFEQTLQVAEEQAAKLLAEAAEEANEIRDAANAEARELYTSSVSQAEALLTESQSRARRAEAQAKSRAAAEVSQAEDGLADARADLVEARTIIETAQRRGAKFVTETEIAASDRRARLHQEIEDVKTELDTSRQIAERDQLRIDYDIKIAEDEAERERLALNEEAVAKVQRLSEESSARVADAVARAGDLTAQAEAELSEHRKEANRILREAREDAARTISEARRLSENLVNRYEEYSSEAFVDAESRIEWLEAQSKIMDGFAFELRSLSSIDSQVVLDEMPNPS